MMMQFFFSKQTLCMYELHFWNWAIQILLQSFKRNVSEIDDERGFNDRNFWIYNVFLSWSNHYDAPSSHDELYMSDQMGGKLHSKLQKKNDQRKIFLNWILFQMKTSIVIF